MIEQLEPKDIEALALEARVSITDVLDRSGVSRGTFYRWRRGEGNMLPLTKARLVDAINSISADKAA